MNLLARILEAKRAELESEKSRLPIRRAIEMASGALPSRSFAPGLRRRDRINVIAEVKGAARPPEAARGGPGPVEAARACALAGAAAISVLTDARFLNGSPSHLADVREAVDLPILRKDFLFDEYQVYRSRGLGADALLLIARVLPPKTLTMLIGVSRSLHMEALVEVHSEEDLRKALDCGASIIGVNNRDPDTMRVSIETSLRLAPLLPEAVTKVSVSGIVTRADLDGLRAAGYDAFLIGERLMRDEDPGAALRSLIGS
ncbi:MAG TPA: indole-3-glycerol phosphate synthase TrpC [Candidatus Cryosericum sp.]|nr:indole-3-glycerol phosphate synthase TrpC [Candidatus Cryosericum sp.]